MPAHVGRLSASSAGRPLRMTLLLMVASVALATVESATLRKESTKDTAVGVTTSAPNPSTNLSEEAPKVPLLPHPPAPRSLDNVPSMPEGGRKSLRRKGSKKKSPNHALISRFGLSRWKEEEARRGAAVESWRHGETSPRIPVKEKKGGGSKRRSSEEGESHMYYVRLPPSHHYYTPFLHGTAEAEDAEQPLEATSRDHDGFELGVHGHEDDDHVVRIEPLRVHDHHAASTHHSQHRHHAVRRLPLSFLSNGRPGPVYHWNLPLIRGEEQIKRGWKKVYNGEKPLESVPGTPVPTAASMSQSPTPADTKLPHIESDVFHVVKTVRGRVHPMAVRTRVNGNRKPFHRKPLSQPATSFPISSYYTRKGDKNESHAVRTKSHEDSMQKSFFQGNGKPHGFYVLNGSKKYYHRFLP